MRKSFKIYASNHTHANQIEATIHLLGWRLESYGRFTSTWSRIMGDQLFIVRVMM